MNKLWFFGLPLSLPTGGMMAVIYACIAGYYHSYMQNGFADMQWAGISNKDIAIMAIIIIITVIGVLLFNLMRYLLHGQTDFVPHNDNSVTSTSKDKRKAQNHPVPPQYLSTQPDGLTVGRRRGKYVRIPFMMSPEHQIIFGSPGSKKSNIIKNGLIEIFNFDSSVSAVLAIDCKPELSRECVYEGRPDVKVINPSATDRWGFDVYYGLTDKSTDDDLKDRFSMVARTLIVNSGGDNAFFYVSAQNILTAFLMYGFRKGYSFGEAVLTVMDASTEDLISEILNDDEMDQHPKIKRLVREFDGKDSDAFQDITMTLQQDLAIFDVDTVQQCFAANNPKMASPADLANGVSLFVAIPDHLLKSYSPVFRLITQLCLSHMMSLPEWTRRDKKPVWFLIDEAGSIGPIPDMLEALARGRSKKIQITLICQSYAQMEQTYGKEGAVTITDCVKTTIVLSCFDTHTARMFSDRIGTYRETKISKQKKGSGTASKNESEEYRPIMDISDIAELERDEKVLVFAGGNWFLVDKAPYYTIPKHKNASDTIQGKNSRFYPNGV